MTARKKPPPLPSSARRFAALLERMLVSDRRAVEAVLAFRVPCSPDFAAAHPDAAQVEGERFLVGAVGLINVALGGSERLEVTYDERRRHVVRVEVLPRDFG